MSWMLAVTLAAVVTLARCGNNTVTDEVSLEFEVKDLDGPGVDYRGRITIALFGDAAPVTVLNFKSLVKGYKRGKQKLQYKNTIVHRIVPDFVIQMGDITAGDGTGGTSIYGGYFADEDMILSHRSVGWLAMANTGPDTNGSQFYFTLNKARWLDGHHVVFGKIIQGYEVLKVLGEVEIDKTNSKPKKRVKIVDTSIEKLDRQYDMDEDQLDAVEDL